jgi:Dockerin type I domain
MATTSSNIKLPSGTTAVHHFYRLLGDVTGDGTVETNDLNEIEAEISLSNSTGLAPLGADVTGDGTISSLDLTLATRARGHKLKSGLSLG